MVSAGVSLIHAGSWAAWPTRTPLSISRSVQYERTLRVVRVTQASDFERQQQPSPAHAVDPQRCVTLKGRRDPGPDHLRSLAQSIALDDIQHGAPARHAEEMGLESRAVLERHLGKTYRIKL